MPAQAYLLNIDASTSTLYISLTCNGQELHCYCNEMAQQQASQLHPAIDELLQRQSICFAQLAAVAVLSGPGSYTGLRVAMAAAKGFCVALGIPLIACTSLQAAAYAIGIEQKNSGAAFNCCYFPRANEVIFQRFNNICEAIGEAQATTLEEYLITDAGTTLFAINAAPYDNNTLLHNTLPTNFLHKSFESYAFQLFSAQNFSNLVTSNPAYIKPTFISQEKSA